MTAFSAPIPAIATDDRLLHAAVVAYLGRYRDQSRLHTGSDLKVFLSLVCQSGPGSAPRRSGRHRTVCALVAGDPLLPALDSLAAVVCAGRLLPDLRHRPDPAVLAGRLRPSVTGTRRVTHPR